MLKNYLLVFLISMVPIIELRCAIPIAEAMGLNIFIYYPVAILGNIVPVPFIYLFARKFLLWKINQNGMEKHLVKNNTIKL